MAKFSDKHYTSWHIPLLCASVLVEILKVLESTPTSWWHHNSGNAASAYQWKTTKCSVCRGSI